MKIIFSILFLLSTDLLASGFFEGDTSLAENYYKIADDFIIKAEYDSALFYLEKAEKIFYENEVWNKYVGTLNMKTHSLKELGKFDSALVIGNKALEFGEKYLKNDKTLAQAYNQIGYTYKNLGVFEKALINAKKSKSILSEFPSNAIKAENYSLLGQIYKEISDYDSSLYAFEKSIEIKIEILGKDDHSISTEYNNMALTFAEKGDNEKAREYFFKSLELKIKALGENHADVGTIYGNLGANYFSQGENDLALEYYLKGLSIDLKLLDEDHAYLGLRYNNIAMAYRVKGDFDKAIEYALKSKNIMLNSYGEKHPYYATIINNIGRIYSDKKDFDNALQFFNSSYEIFKESLGESHPATAQIQHNIGETYNKIGDYDKGLEFLKKSLSVRFNILGTKHPKYAATLIEVGKNYYYRSMPDSALYFFQQTIISSASNFNEMSTEANPDLSLSRHDRELLEALYFKAEALNNKYLFSGNLADLKYSLASYLSASQLAVKMRQNYRSESSKFSIGHTGFNTILEGIFTANKLYELTGEEAYLENAFELIENGKAGILSDALAEANAKNFSGIPDSLLEKEKLLRIDLANYDTQIQKEREKIRGIDSTRLLKLENSFFNLHRDYEKMIGLFEDNYNEYFKLKFSGRNHNLKEIQNELSHDSAILEYALGDSVLYIFLITKNNFSLESVRINSPLKNEVILFRNALSNIDFKQYTNSAYNLYSVLIKPVENKISNIEKLYIIPDGILNYLPFESLLKSQTVQYDFSRMDYLINHYEISYYFSASTLHEVIQNKIGDNKSFAGFAPVFNNESETAAKIASVMDTVLTRSVIIEGKNYSSLPETENEIKNIFELFQAKNIPSEIFLNSSAKEETIKSDSIQNYGMVHIASHGFLNEYNPKLSGILFWIDNKETKEDGILYAGEIYNLNLNTDLLVLSACETGLGKIVRGEGLIGLTRGFTYAGAKNIVVSLWQVADKSTSELMIEFYRNILSGQSYSSALRNAKLKLIKDGIYSYPLEWSPFVMLGR